MLAQYPAVADAASIKLMPRLSFRSPGSFIQLLLVLFCKTLAAMFVDDTAIHETNLVDYYSEAPWKSSSFYLSTKD
jgi:hypothetical protein